MKITEVKSHVLRCDMPTELGYSQQYYTQRTAHLVEVTTDEGVTGWGECFGPGNVALANKAIVEKVIQPMILGDDPMKRDVIWHKVYNLLRDHGQKGMPMQALSGVDIALWDIAGKITGQSISNLIGGRHRETVGVYGYGMMLERKPVEELAAMFTDEAAKIVDMGFRATKMKTGLGPKPDVKLCQAVRKGVGDDFKFMVDANHAYTTSDAFYVGRALDELDAYWFEEPVAPEDHDGYRELRAGLKTNIAGGEAEFNRWGWRQILENRGLDIAQPEVCALGGITEYLRVLALCHAHFTPVINHVWGSAIAVATNLQLLAAMPPMPGGLHPWEAWLEFDTTENKFRDNLLENPLNIQKQVKDSGGMVTIPNAPGLGVEPDRDFIEKYTWPLEAQGRGGTMKHKPGSLIEWVIPFLFFVAAGWSVWHIPNYLLDFIPPSSESLFDQMSALAVRKDATPNLPGLFGGFADPLDWLSLVALPILFYVGCKTIQIAPMEFQEWRWIDRPSIFIGRVTMIMILAMTLVMLYEVFLRYAIEAPTLWANELTLWIGGFVFLCSGLYGMQQRSHIRIFILYDAVPRWLQRVFDIISATLFALFAIFMIFGSYKQVFVTKFYKWEMWGTAFDPPIPATVQPMVLIIIALVAIQGILNVFNDWNLDTKASNTDEIDEDEIAAIKRSLGEN